MHGGLCYAKGDMEEENVIEEHNPSLNFSRQCCHIENTTHPLNNQRKRFIHHIRIFLPIIESMKKARLICRQKGKISL